MILHRVREGMRLLLLIAHVGSYGMVLVVFFYDYVDKL